MGDRRKSLISHELTRAKLRLLTPISEESTSPRVKRHRNMVMISDKIDERRQATDLEMLRELQEMQPDRAQIAAEYTHDLKNVVESYLNEPSNGYGHREPPQPRELRVLHRRGANCECCEARNRENSQRRRDQYPDQYGYWTDDPNAVEMVPYGSPGKYNPELLTAPRGRFPVLVNPGTEMNERPREGMTERPRVQVLYPNYLGDRPADGPYESMLFPTPPGVPGQGSHQNSRSGSPRGSATLLYPYTPRNMLNYSSHDYDIYGYNTMNLGNSSDYERHLMGDIMAAAARYDNNMNRLEGHITHLNTPRDTRTTRFNNSGRL